MVKAVLTRRGDRFLKCRLDGHAGNGELCAALSFLTESVTHFALYNGFSLEDDGGSGKSELNLELLERFDETLYDYFIVTLYLLGRKYGGELEIEISEE